MRIKNAVNINNITTKAMRGAITDWYSLGSTLNISAGLMAYALKFRDELQKKIRLHGRTVYKSIRSLKHIQAGINLLLDGIVEEIPNNEVILSYRKGKCAQEEIKRFSGKEYMISFDIRKFYDHINLKHIEKALQQHGFCDTGARLIGRYCLVKRNIHGKEVHTLQQGCVCSPILSNIVGYHYIDKKLISWFSEAFPEVKVYYARYCDNVYAFFDEEPSQAFRDAYKAKIIEVLKESGFRAHDWAFVSQKNKKRNMKFIGVVLNHTPRLERREFARLRGMFYQFARNGFTYSGVSKLCNVEDDRLQEHTMLSRKAAQILRGYVSYVSSVNKKQALQLKKLLAVAMLPIDGFRNNKAVVSEIRKYRDETEGVKDYSGRVWNLASA